MTTGGAARAVEQGRGAVGAATCPTARGARRGAVPEDRADAGRGLAGAGEGCRASADGNRAVEAVQRPAQCGPDDAGHHHHHQQAAWLADHAGGSSITPKPR